MRWLVAVLVLVLGCKREAPEARTPTPPTADEAKAFGIELARVIAPCDRDRLDTLIDRELLIDRAIAGRALKRRDMDEVRTTFVSNLCNSLDGTWRARFVRNRIDNGVPKPVIRLTSDAGIEYLELELDKQDGAVRVVDFFVFTRGELMSQSMSALIDVILAKDRSDAIATSSRMQRIQQFILAEQWQDAYDAIQRLPADVRDTKQVRHVEIRAVGGLANDELYAKTIEAYAAKFPNDPSLDLLRIDAEYIRKRSDEVLKLIDALDKRIGGDPYLDTMRAGALVDLGKLDEALKRAKQAAAAVPDIPDVWRNQLALQVAAGHNRGALKTLETLQQTFKELPDEAALRADARFAALADTAEYAAWKQR